MNGVNPGDREPVFDMHTHFFGPEFFRVLAAAAHPRGETEPGFARLRAGGIEVPRVSAAEHARRWVAEMDRHGVDRMVTFASLPEEMPSVAEGTEAAGGRLIPFCLVDPARPDAAGRVAELAGGYGVRGLVLFPAMHRVDLSDRALDPFYAAVERAGLPLVVHMGVLRVHVRDVLGLPSDFDLRYAVPGRLDGAAARHPGIRFVIPHFGGGWFEEVLALGRARANVSVDTSSSNSWIRLRDGLTLAGVFRRSLDALGPERVHFGTDSSAFPRGWRREVYDEQRRALDEAGVGAADRERILSGNTRDLVGG